MKKAITAVLSAGMAVSLCACSASGKYKAGTYTGEAKGHSSSVKATVEFSADAIKNAIFLRIVAKFVKVPFYVQHFKSESLEYLVSARYPLCISTKHSWTTEARSSSSSCAPASISSSMTRSQPR